MQRFVDSQTVVKKKKIDYVNSFKNKFPNFKSRFRFRPKLCKHDLNTKNASENLNQPQTK